MQKTSFKVNYVYVEVAIASKNDMVAVHEGGKRKQCQQKNANLNFNVSPVKLGLLFWTLLFGMIPFI